MFKRRMLSWVGSVSRSFVWQKIITLLAHLKSFIVSTWLPSREHFAGDVVKAFTIVAFLFAADYFTDKPSLEARIWDVQKAYYRSFVKDFFRDNQIDSPPILTETPLRYILEESDQFPQALTNPQGPNIEHIREELRRQGYAASGSMISYHTSQLDRYFDLSRYRKHVYMFPDFGSMWTDEGLNEFLCCVESISSPMEYYTILAAVIYSRTYRQQVSVKNDGDVDLSDIDVTVPAPVSRLSQRRGGNILYYRVMGDLLYDIEQYSDRITVHIPSLKQGQYVGIEVLTRENQLIDTDLLCTYKSDRRFGLAKIWIWAIGILIAQWVFRRWGGRPAVPDPG